MKIKEKDYQIFFTNLSNPLKIKIVLCLKLKDSSVTEIYKCLNSEQSKVSHALASLKKCRIVKSEQKGKKRIYSLNKDTIVPIFKFTDKHIKRHSLE